MEGGGGGYKYQTQLERIEILPILRLSPAQLRIISFGWPILRRAETG